MSHINHIRRIEHLSRLSLKKAVDLSFYKSFAAFCGLKYQRNKVGIYEMSAFCGDIGVVLLHNDPKLNEELKQIFLLKPSLTFPHNEFKMFIANEVDSNGNIISFYDPFYGLKENAILDSLVPINSGISSTAEIQTLKSVLLDYLSIMHYQFNKNSSLFGDYAYNLDLLIELTQIPYPNLFEKVLSYLPKELYKNLSARLSAEGAQQKAYNAVISFSQELSNFFWTKKSFPKHSKLSIISTVKSKNLISIYIPESRPGILDYIAVELQQLNNSQIPYLLLESDINLNNSQKLKNIFLSEHSMSSYYTGILAENTSSVVGQDASNKDLSNLFSQTQEMFIFNCSSIVSAQPFSDGIGNYYRKFVQKQTNYNGGFFQLFKSYGYGNVTQSIIQNIINPEELTSLNSGCLIYGKNYPVPILIDNFII